MLQDVGLEAGVEAGVHRLARSIARLARRGGTLLWSDRRGRSAVRVVGWSGGSIRTHATLHLHVSVIRSDVTERVTRR